MVKTYDDDTAKGVSHAATAAQGAENDLANAQKTFAHAAATLERAEAGLRWLARDAAATAKAAQAKLKAAADARAGGEDFLAIVHLQDLSRLRERLTANVKLTGEPLTFDVDRTNATQLTNSVRAEWTTAFTAYEDAAAALFAAEVAAIEARIALARAEAEAAVRNATRLTAAAEAVRAERGGP